MFPSRGTGDVRMRVLINGMVLNGKKTGIGHYAAELVRCMTPLVGEQNLCVHRPAWVQPAREWLTRLRPPASPVPSASSQTPQKLPLTLTLRGQLVNALRDVGKTAYLYQF